MSFASRLIGCMSTPSTLNGSVRPLVEPSHPTQVPPVSRTIGSSARTKPPGLVSQWSPFHRTGKRFAATMSGRVLAGACTTSFMQLRGYCGGLGHVPLCAEVVGEESDQKEGHADESHGGTCGGAMVIADQ